MTRYWGQNIIIIGAQATAPGSTPKLPDALQAQYESMTQDVVRLIAATPAGRIVINAINGARGSVTIRPMPPASNYNSITIPNTPAAANAKTRDPLPMCGNTACTGAGSDITIFYSPSMWFDPLNEDAVAGGGNYLPDDVLFHEFVHALRGMLGLWDLSLILQFDNIEDFYAITLTNIYLSLNHRGGSMRGSHAQHWEPLSVLITDKSYYVRYFDHIDLLSRRMPKLFSDIAAFPTGWNPLRASGEVAEATQRLFSPSFGQFDLLSTPPSLGGPANVIPLR